MMREDAHLFLKQNAKWNDLKWANLFQLLIILISPRLFDYMKLGNKMVKTISIKIKSEI